LRTGTTTSWVVEGFVEHNCIKNLWAKRKTSLGGFGVLFFQHFSSQFEELIYSLKKNEIFIDFLECIPENDKRHAVGKILFFCMEVLLHVYIMITLDMSWYGFSERLLLCTEYFCKKEIFVILFTSFLQTVDTGQAGG
jgi:hypothetical protein